MAPSKKQQEQDEQFAAHIPGVLQYHHLMLSDGVRNAMLAKVIEQCVTEETSFLDVGAGTGVWAIMAAKLGAKRVVAVEVEECLIPFIHKHAQENGVAHLIEIIHGRSDDVKIRGKFDVIVSELFGADAFGAATVNSFIDIRDRFLAPGGKLIPQKLTMFVVPAHVKESTQDIPAGISLNTGFLKTVRLNYPQNISRFELGRVEFLAEPKAMIEIDFGSVGEPPSLAGLTASWQLDDLSRANAVATYNRSTFADGVEMDTIDSQSWGVGTYEFLPFDQKAGELEFSLTLESTNANWRVSVPSDPAIPPQTYSPVFAFTRIKMAQQMTPHRRYKAPKKESRKTVIACFI